MVPPLEAARLLVPPRAPLDAVAEDQELDRVTDFVRPDGDAEAVGQFVGRAIELSPVDRDDDIAHLQAGRFRGTVRQHIDDANPLLEGPLADLDVRGMGGRAKTDPRRRLHLRQRQSDKNEPVQHHCILPRRPGRFLAGERRTV